MELIRLQTLIAKLATDDSIRRQLKDQPAEFCDRFQLSLEDLSEIQAINPEQMRRFSQSLSWKRRQALANCFPWTRTALGPVFEEQLEAYVFNGHTVEHHDPRADAIAFASQIGSTLKVDARTGWHRDVIRHELISLRFASAKRRWQVAWFAHLPRALPDVKPGACCVLWVRRSSGRIRTYRLG